MTEDLGLGLVLISPLAWLLIAILLEESSNYFLDASAPVALFIVLAIWGLLIIFL